MVSARTIDIEKVLSSKLGKRKRFVPRWIIRWLERLIHQDWINAFIRQEGDKSGLEWIEDCVRYVNVDVDVVGGENLPPDDGVSRYTFVSNHPLGGADGIILGAILGRHYKGRLRYIANDLLMNLDGLAPLIVPVNVTGAQDRDTPRRINEVFDSENNLIVFPARLCSRKIGGKIQDLPWNKSFVAKSIASKRDIVPIYFEGRNSERFYRLSNFSKFLGLKFNLAMLLLVDELYKHQGAKFVVRIGKPISYESLTESKSPSQWALFIQDIVNKMGN